MTELAIRESRAPALVDDTYSRLAAWAESAQAAHQVATTLVQTSFVPEAFRGKAGEATAAILAGAEVGLSPMASLRSFDIINGTAAPRAITLRAVVQSRGHEMKVTESTATRAVVEGRRQGESTWQKSVWTIERAKQLGLTGKKNWQSQPGAMLVARATSEVARWIGSDAIAGIPYSYEEIDDGDQVGPVQAVAEIKPERRTVKRAPLAAPERVPDPTPDPEPPLEDEPAAAPMVEPQSGVKLITPAQQKMMHALLNEAGKADREAGLEYICEVVGRPVETTKELTMREAGIVIDSLAVEPSLDDADWPPTSAPSEGA